MSDLPLPRRAPLLLLALLALGASGPYLRSMLVPIHMREPGWEISGHEYQYDPLLGWRNIPDWKATTRGRAITFNSQGLRDHAREIGKPAGKRRMLALGGSYTWGYGVGDDEIFTRRLEQRLGPEWDVVNAGVSGWSTDQEYLYFEQEGKKYAPEVVLVELCLIGNPIYSARSKQFGLYKPMFELEGGELVLRNYPVPTPDEKVETMVGKTDPIERTIALLLALTQSCQQLGCRVVVFKFSLYLIASEEELKTWLEAQARIEAALAGHAGIYYLDLDLAFYERKLSVGSLLEGNEEGHWNAWGHERVAEILEDFLSKNSLLSRP